MDSGSDARFPPIRRNGYLPAGNTTVGAARSHAMRPFGRCPLCSRRPIPREYACPHCVRKSGAPALRKHQRSADPLLVWPAAQFQWSMTFPNLLSEDLRYRGHVVRAQALLLCLVKKRADRIGEGGVYPGLLDRRGDEPAVLRRAADRKACGEIAVDHRLPLHMGIRIIGCATRND